MSERKLEILTAIANQTFVYDPRTVRKDDRGQVKETHWGYRIKATKLGKTKTREGDIVRGVWADQLSYASKDRRNRALGRIILSDVVQDMQSKGYKVDQRAVLEWFNAVHGGQKGVTWNVYDEQGKVYQSDAPSLAAEPAEVVGVAGQDPAILNDERYLEKQPDKRWYCSACKEYRPGQGLAGHRRSKEHKTNVARLNAEAA